MRAPAHRAWFLMSALILAGCNTVQDAVDDLDIDAALRSVVEHDGAFSIEGLSDDGLQDDDYDQTPGLNKALADTLWPRHFRGIRWGRQITDREWSLAIDSLVDDTAYVTISTSITGTLRVGGWIRNDDSVLVIQDTLIKPFKLSATRRVRFVRVGETGDPLQDWRITGLTAILGTAGTRVALADIVFTAPDTHSPYFQLERDKLLSRFFNRQSLPSFPPLGAVPTFVTIENSDPGFPLWSGESVVIRHGRSAGMVARRRLNDRGLGVDAQVLDDIYSGIWFTREEPVQPHPFRLFVEVIDLATLFVEAEPFHSEFIGLPYQVR